MAQFQVAESIPLEVADQSLFSAYKVPGQPAGISGGLLLRSNLMDSPKRKGWRRQANSPSNVDGAMRIPNQSCSRPGPNHSGQTYPWSRVRPSVASPEEEDSP